MKKEVIVATIQLILVLLAVFELYMDHYYVGFGLLAVMILMEIVFNSSDKEVSP